MPSIPRPRLRRAHRAGVDAGPEHAAEPNVEIVVHEGASPVGAPGEGGGGLRWINIERPGPSDRAWLEEHFEFHPLDFEDVASRNQRPKIDEYPDYLFIVLHFPVFDKSLGRLNTAELDMFVGPDFLITLPNQPIPPVDYLFERCESTEEVREDLMSKGSGYLLYKIVDDSFDYCFPMLRKMGNKLERVEEDIFEGRSEEVVRDISNAKQEIINFRKIIRPQRPVLRDLERLDHFLVVLQHVPDALRGVHDVVEVNVHVLRHVALLTALEIAQHHTLGPDDLAEVDDLLLGV